MSGLRPVADRGGPFLDGGTGSRREIMAWASRSYSTDVLRGMEVFGRDELEEAHALVGLWEGCISAAWMNAVAI